MAILTSSWKCRPGGKPNEQHNCLPFRGENVPWENDHHILNVNAHFAVAVSPRHTAHCISLASEQDWRPLQIISYKMNLLESL